MTPARTITILFTVLTTNVELAIRGFLCYTGRICSIQFTFLPPHLICPTSWARLRQCWCHQLV